ncbi:hypothetical protein FRC10_000894, partial [Ceratobasidium sp. 414]
HQYEGLRRQLEARNKPKHTSGEASALSKLQKFGFLTNPEIEEAFRKEMEEDAARREAEAQKAATKEARTKETEGRRSMMIADSTHVFEGTLQGFKTANLERLGDLAACLGVPFAGLTRAAIFERILQHFEAHSELKAIPRYAGLFRASRASRASHQRVELEQGAPVPTAEGADFPPEPPSLAGPLVG